MSRLHRRDFLRLSAAGAAGAALSGCATSGPASARPAGANGDIRLAIVGVHSKGADHIKHVLSLSGVRLVALCDVDRAVLDERKAEVEKQGGSVRAYVDFRELLDQADIDAVVIATPNHQHTLQAIWACQAGKDVYVEKPVSYNLFESRQVVAAAARYGRIVQAGTQNRSDLGLRPAIDFIRGGGLGRLKVVRGFCYKKRDSIGLTTGPQPVPESVNYDLWCGPAPLAPLRRKSLHYDWHWQWACGNGDIGNQGIHELDICRWALGADDLPPRVLVAGGRFGYTDDGETPNTLLAFYDYRPAPILFEVRGLPRGQGDEAEDAYSGIRVGVVVEGEKGYFAGGRGGGKVFDWDKKQLQHFKGDGGAQHMPNFLAAVRSRRARDLAAPIRGGALSSDLPHLANMAFRVGAAAAAGAVREQMATSAPAQEALDRMKAHLEANGVDLVKNPLTAGGWLEWNARRDRFTAGPGYERANDLFTRLYRAPFIVPEKV